MTSYSSGLRGQSAKLSYVAGSNPVEVLYLCSSMEEHDATNVGLLQVRVLSEIF